MVAATSPQFTALSEVLLRKTRSLPVDGDVLVRLGDPVRPTDLVARAKRPSRPTTVMVGHRLGVPPNDLGRLLRRWAGEPVQRDEILAERKGPLGLGKRVCRSPIDGVVVSGPHSAGEVVLSGPDEEIQLLAGLPGRVAAVIPHRGVVVETTASYVQGVGGYGDEASGPLLLASDSADGEVNPDRLDEECQGAVLVAGRVGQAALSKVVSAGVAGLVVGGISGDAFYWLLVNRPALAVVVTEGAGAFTLAPATFRLLQSRQGSHALLNGTPQSGAGPEVVIPVSSSSRPAALPRVELQTGAAARVDAGGWAGGYGRVVDLPPVPCRLPSGVVAPVVRLELEGGQQVVVARGNVTVLG